MNMADRLKELRKSQGLTQIELATATGLSFHAINSYESGRRTPNSKAMVALERYFNVSGEYLRGETDQRDLMKWDDPEIMGAIQDNLPEQVSRLNGILADCPAQDQKLAFDFLVELGHVLKLADQAQRTVALSLLHSSFAASTHFVDICINAVQDIDATRVEGAKQTALEQYNKALSEALIFFAD